MRMNHILQAREKTAVVGLREWTSVRQNRQEHRNKDPERFAENFPKGNLF